MAMSAVKQIGLLDILSKTGSRSPKVCFSTRSVIGTSDARTSMNGCTTPKDVALTYLATSCDHGQ
jgi:hypothetical protein